MDVPEWLPMVASLGLLATMVVKAGRNDILVYLATFYFYFAFGPFINYLLGNEIYFGIVRDTIVPATILIMLAIVGMFLGAMLIRSPTFPDRSVDFTGGRQYPLVSPLLALLALYTVFTLVSLGPSVFGMAKLAKIDAVGSELHYSYLLVQFFAASLYFIVDRSGLGRLLYYANFGLYVSYCVIFSERDFIFAIATIVLHRLVVGRIQIRAVHLAGAALLVYGATYFFELRSGSPDVGLAEVLNQGSLLFIDSFVLALVPDVVAFMSGWTYLNSIASLLPGFIYPTDFYLLYWFVDQYAPGSPIGYGFSLESEAYINFGFVGVPIVFAIIAMVQRFLSARLARHPFYAYSSVLYTGWLLYSFRGDSLQLLNGVIYGMVLFGVLYVTSRPITSMQEGTPDARTDRQIPEPTGLTPLVGRPQIVGGAGHGPADT